MGNSGGASTGLCDICKNPATADYSDVVVTQTYPDTRFTVFICGHCWVDSVPQWSRVRFKQMGTEVTRKRGS